MYTADFVRDEAAQKAAFISATGNAFQPTLKEQVNSQMLLATTELPASIVYSRFIVFLVCLLDAHISDAACSYCETSCLHKKFSSDYTMGLVARRVRRTLACKAILLC